MEGVLFPLDHDMTAVYAADATQFPPRGVLGGFPAAPGFSGKRLIHGEVVTLPSFNEEVCRAGEKLVFFACGGGGYGEPRNRNPERVVATVNRGWLTPHKAEAEYGVVVRFDAASGDYVVDAPATDLLRGQSA